METHPLSFPAPGERRGVEHAGVIDLITRDAADGKVELVMFEPRAWLDGEDGDEQLFQLQEKFNAYMGFALDGEMAEAYPDLVTKPLRLVLRCVDLPPAPAVEFLSHVREQIALQDIELEVRYANEQSGSCGSGCACHT